MDILQPLPEEVGLLLRLDALLPRVEVAWFVMSK
jgi:hypothetical protein